MKFIGFSFRDGQAIWMDENIRFGKTDRCSTFNNPPLCASGDFEIRVLEVYGFAGAWGEERTWHYDVSVYLIPYCHLITLFYIYRVVYIIYKYLRVCAKLSRSLWRGIIVMHPQSLAEVLVLRAYDPLLRSYKRFCTDWDYVDLSTFCYASCSIICLDVVAFTLTLWHSARHSEFRQ